MATTFEFLTLTPPEARLIVAALNGHLRSPGIAAYDELSLSIADSCGPHCAGERLDIDFNVPDWEMLVQRVANLSEAQANAVLNATEAFWQQDDSLAIDEMLQKVGLL